MKKDKKMPMFQALKLNIRALMVIYQKFPQMVLSRLILQSWLAITPYVGIYLSALVIDELGGSKNPERLKTLVLITLASAVLIGLISALLTKWKNTQDAGKLYKLEYITSLKLFNMDFADVDSTETHNLLSAIRQSMASGRDRPAANKAKKGRARFAGAAASLLPKPLSSPMPRLGEADKECSGPQGADSWAESRLNSVRMQSSLTTDITAPRPIS